MTIRSDESLGSSLTRTARLIRTRLNERLSPLGLTQSKWLVLLYLSRSGGCMPQKDIAERVGVESPTVVRVLDGLERMGLIERRDQPDDRRSKNVLLTAQASGILAEITRITEDFRKDLWSGVCDQEMAVVRRVIDKLQENLGVSRRDRDRCAAGDADKEL